MKINIEFMGFLRRPKSINRIETIEIPDNSSLKNLLKFLEYSDIEIRRIQAFLKDGTKIDLKEILKDGAELFLTIPIGGG